MQKYYQYVFYLVFLISANANANPRDYEIGERIYELCAQQTSAVFQKMRKQVQGDKDSEVCFEVSQECNYDGDTDNYTKLKGKRTKQCVDGSVFDDLDCDNSGRCMPRDRKKCPGGKNCGGDDGIDIDGGGSVTVPGACYRKCRKGVDKKKCRKCLRKYDAIDPSCSRPSKCGDIIIDDGEDEDDGSGRKRKKRRGDKDGDCVDCKSRAYPPGTGFANVVGALGGFIQSAGIGLGASGVMSYLDKKDCRNKFTTHNQQRIENSQSMLDYTSKICPGNVGGGFYGGGGGGGYYGNPAYGGIGSYPGSQYAFNGGALGQYNPQAGISLNAGLGGLFGGQFGGGGQFGNGGQWGGGNGYGNGGQWGGVNGYANGGQWGGANGNGNGGQWGGQFGNGGQWGGGAGGQWNGQPYNTGINPYNQNWYNQGANGLASGSRYNNFYRSYDMSVQGRNNTGVNYINSSRNGMYNWQYNPGV